MKVAKCLCRQCHLPGESIWTVKSGETQTEKLKYSTNDKLMRIISSINTSSIWHYQALSSNIKYDRTVEGKFYLRNVYGVTWETNEPNSMTRILNAHKINDALLMVKMKWSVNQKIHIILKTANTDRVCKQGYKTRVNLGSMLLCGEFVGGGGGRENQVAKVKLRETAH